MADKMDVTKRQEVTSTVKGITVNQLLESSLLEKIKEEYPDAQIFALGVDIKPKTQTVEGVIMMVAAEKGVAIKSYSPDTDSKILAILNKMIKA